MGAVLDPVGVSSSHNSIGIVSVDVGSAPGALRLRAARSEKLRIVAPVLVSTSTNLWSAGAVLSSDWNHVSITSDAVGAEMLHTGHRECVVGGCARH